MFSIEFLWQFRKIHCQLFLRAQTIDQMCGWEMGGNNDDGEEKSEEGGQKQKNEIKRIRK